MTSPRPQHMAVIAKQADVVPPESRPTAGPIALLPRPNDRFVAAVEAGGGTVAEISSETRGIIWLSSSEPERLVEALEANPQVEWVQLPWAGVDAFAEVIRPFAGRPLPLWTSAKGAYSQPVAEHALALTLALLRVFPRRVAATSWSTVPEGRSLYGLSVVIIGAGGIALELIRLLEAFGVSITVVRRSADAVEGADATVTVDRLAEVLPGADVVVVAAALTGDTTGLIGEAELALMKPEAVLVNIARGGLVEHRRPCRGPGRRGHRGRRRGCHRPGAAPRRASALVRAQRPDHPAQRGHAGDDRAAPGRAHPAQRGSFPRRRPFRGRRRPGRRVLSGPRSALPRTLGARRSRPRFGGSGDLAKIGNAVSAILDSSIGRAADC